MIQHGLHRFRLGAVHIVAAIIPEVVVEAVLGKMEKIIFEFLLCQMFFEQFCPIVHQLKLVALKGSFQCVKVFQKWLLFNVVDGQKPMEQFFEVRHDIVELLLFKVTFGK